MNEFKVGDRVRYMGLSGKSTGTPAGAHISLQGYLGAEGKVLEVGRYGAYKVMLDGPYTRDIAENYLVLARVEYDRATVDAIVAHMRGQRMFEVPNMVEKAFAELTAPTTHKVVVEFTVRDEADLVSLLDSAADEWEETIVDYEIKEDNA